MIFILLGLIAIILAFILYLLKNQFLAISTIEKIDDYGMYQMTYNGDISLDSCLTMMADNASDIEQYLSMVFCNCLPTNSDMSDAGCTAFVSKNDNNEIIFGRNFDFGYSPSMVLYYYPEDGYASLSTANLSFVGYSKDILPSGIKSILCITAQLLPCDGMNEKRVAMAMVPVPESDVPHDSSKVTLNTTTAIRLVLDKAATVDEAIDLLKEYNMYFSCDINCHYLIADKTGRSVIVEYYDGALREVYPSSDYQIASNFIAYNDENTGHNYAKFEGYEEIKNAIEENNGTLSENESLDLLAKVGVTTKKGENKLQWSSLYNLSTLSEDIFAHGKVENTKHFDLK